MKIFAVVALPLINALGQIFIKKGSVELNKLRSYMLLIIAYSLFLISTVVTIYVLTFIPTKYFAILIAFNFILTTLFSYFILKEKVGKYTIIGTLLVFIGVIIFSYK